MLFHHSKNYLKYCLEQITYFLEKEKLTLNNKTRIYKSTNNFIFLGRTKKIKYSKYREVNRKLKKRKYLYKNGNISLMSFVSSSLCFKNLLEK